MPRSVAWAAVTSAVTTSNRAPEPSLDALDWRDRPAASSPSGPTTARLEAVLDELGAPAAAGLRGRGPNAHRVAGSGRRRARPSCCRRATAPSRSTTSRPTASGTSSRSSCRWPSCSPTPPACPTVKVGRIAGQFAKPRSSATESRDGVELPSFRGHIVNDLAFDAAARVPDPARLVAAYHQSASTLNLLRAFTKGGFADLTRCTLEPGVRRRRARGPALRGTRRRDRPGPAVHGGLRHRPRATSSQLHEVDFYTSHEALMLGYEEALTRQDSLTGDWYDCSAHLLWIGERTRQIDGAHVEFLSGVQQPDRREARARPRRPTRPSRCAPGSTPSGRRAGSCSCRRMGADEGPSACRRWSGGQGAGHPVVWVCDPMHGNTFTTPAATRPATSTPCMAEIRGFFDVHRSARHLAGRCPRRAHGR